MTAASELGFLPDSNEHLCPCPTLFFLYFGPCWSLPSLEKKGRVGVSLSLAFQVQAGRPESPRLTHSTHPSFPRDFSKLHHCLASLQVLGCHAGVSYTGFLKLCIFTRCYPFTPRLPYLSNAARNALFKTRWEFFGGIGSQSWLHIWRVLKNFGAFLPPLEIQSWGEPEQWPLKRQVILMCFGGRAFALLLEEVFSAALDSAFCKPPLCLKSLWVLSDFTLQMVPFLGVPFASASLLTENTTSALSAKEMGV